MSLYDNDLPSRTSRGEEEGAECVGQSGKREGDELHLLLNSRTDDRRHLSAGSPLALSLSLTHTHSHTHSKTLLRFGEISSTLGLQF